MKRVVLTGMSGTSKSTIVEALAVRGYEAIDADSDDWHEWGEGSDRTWRAGRIDWLLSSYTGGTWGWMPMQVE